MNRRTFLIGDTHFGHTNIIKYCNRPFKDVTEMNGTLCNNWNEVVGVYDRVIHLGDFALTTPVEIRAWLENLNGQKILVQGNHDPKNIEELGFDFVVQSMKLRIPGFGNVLMMHYPIESDSALEQILIETDSKLLIHGHQHNATPLFPSKLRANVSCENIDYTPIEMTELLKRWQNV